MIRMLGAVVGDDKENRSTAHSVAWNYAGYAYQLASNLALTSYIVRYIAVPEYGLLLFVMSLSSILYLLDMGISSVLVQAYVGAVAEGDGTRRNDLISTVFWALTALGFVGVLIFSGIAAILPGPFNLPAQYIHEAALIFVVAALVVLVGLPTIAIELAYQASHRFDRINRIQIVTSTIQIALSVVAIAAGFRIVALALVQLVVALLRLILLTLALPSAVPEARLDLGRPRWNLLKPLIRLSKWALFHNLSTAIFDVLAWTILGTLGSMREAAMFGLASKLPKQLWNLVDKGANVTLPVLSQSAAQSNQFQLQQTFLKTQQLIFGAILPFVVLGCLFARPLIQIWAGDQYVAAASVMRWLLLAAFSHAMTFSSDLLLYACKQIKKAAWISLWAGIASIASALILVSRYGATGLAAGMAVSQLLINCTWFTISACRLSHTSPWAMVRAIFDGMTWPIITLALEVALFWRIWARLTSLWLVVAAVAGGCVYIVLWGVRIAIPLYRSRTVIVA